MPETPYSLYIHIPFCRHRCAYCDFNTYAGLDDLIPAYCHALRQEISMVAAAAPDRLPVHTVFFGGGTPSLLPAGEVKLILNTIKENFSLVPQVEISLEANPGTTSGDYLHQLREVGINRLSFGVQSANLEELHMLEREHDFVEVIQSVQSARMAGFDNLNLDLIFGLPYQALETWQHTLSLALMLQPEHFSLYALTLEHGTPMYQWVRRGLIGEPDSDLAAEMYEWAAAHLDRAGYEQYEISNWARLDTGGKLLSCRHNLQYWRYQPYLGFGAGAHGFAAGVRTANVLAPGAYIQRLAHGQPSEFPRSPAAVNVLPIDAETGMGEMMMMGLRLTQEGVAEAVFEARFGQSLESVYASQIQRLARIGLLEWHGQLDRRLRLTQSGRLLGNQVFQEFI
ncbi:MAG: radical SAM family heme chaperone HemW [Anaerolineales bacterium]